MAISGGCTSSRFVGFGSSFERTDNSNFNIGLRYFYSPQRHAWFCEYFFYFGIAPTVYAISDKWGVNAAPEIGLYKSFLRNTVSASINVFYGYDIPVINENAYSNNRHRITVKIGFDIDTGNLLGKEDDSF